MEVSLDRGRWSSARVARIYLNDVLARKVELRFTDIVRGALQATAQALELWLQAALT